MREQFEREILDDPDDLNRYAVYADWLTDQGDPRGEFMQIQLLLESEELPHAQRIPLKQREQLLLDQHVREWVGPLANELFAKEPEYLQKRCEFARGMLDVVLCPQCDAHFASRLVTSPQARFLREFVIEDMTFDEDPWIPKTSNLPNLRVFRFGEGSSHSNGEGVDLFVRTLPRIEVLNLESHSIDTDELFALPMPHLRELTVHHLTHYPVELLAANTSLTKLEQLCFQPHALLPEDDEAYLRLEHMRAIARSPYLQSLRHLEFCSCSMGDEGCAEIVSSGLLGRLRVLDLSHGRVTDLGAAQLARSPDLHKLERLVLYGNCLSATGIRQLQETGVRLEADQQWQMTEDADHQEYLWYGDME